MRLKGKLLSWNDEKGFGFIESSDGGKDVFLHISDLSNRNRRPEKGQTVSYTLSNDAQGRPRASKASLPGDSKYSAPKPNGSGSSMAVSGLFLSIVGILVFMKVIPAVILWVYLALSLVTFLVYAYDKTAAKDGAWRTKEGTLHWLSLLGGWPGALVAQKTLRHKSKKQAFRTVFWITVGLNCMGLLWLSSPAGESVLYSLTMVLS